MRAGTKIKVYYALILVLVITAVVWAMYAEIDYASTPGVDYEITLLTFLLRVFSQPFVWAAVICGWRIQANMKLLKRSKDSERYK